MSTTHKIEIQQTGDQFVATVPSIGAVVTGETTPNAQRITFRVSEGAKEPLTVWMYTSLPEATDGTSPCQANGQIIINGLPLLRGQDALNYRSG